MDRRRRLAFLALDDEVAEAILATLPEPERFTSWRLATDEGLFERGEAAVKLADLLLPGSGRLVGRLPLEAAYRLVARNRHRLGRLVPDGPAPRRFP
jgi:predicted DCC family thiol-disulfide oxidoreductase YuxK